MRKSRLKSILQRIGPVNHLVIRWKEKERKALYGNENPDKTFFVIRRNAPNAGLFSFVITNMGWIRYALDRGYIPVIDMQYYYNTYLTADEVQHINAWDYYFLQPGGYSLDDISKSRNVIISSLNAAKNNPNPLYLGEMKEWIGLAHEVLHFRPEVQHLVEKQRKKLFQDERVLGVLCRGTDYTALRPKGHPIQPDTDAVIAKAQEMMRDQKCTILFLATEDETVYQLFSKTFGTRLRTYSDRISTTNGIFINEYEDQKLERESDPAKAKYLRGLNYAVTIGLLATCNCLVAGQVSGTTGAILLSKGYEKTYLFDLGNYS